jgi:dihydropteroate synthase
MRVVDIYKLSQAKKLMQDIWVDRWGIQIMAPKSLSYLIRIEDLSNISANILKQEMLSLGGDVAVSKDARTGRTKKTDCLLMGNLTQFNRLNSKLKNQPFGLNRLSQDLSLTLENYQLENFSLDLGKYKLNLGARTKIMGIINITPDSFSGDGLYQSQESRVKSQDFLDFIVGYAQQMVKDGAHIIDVGGQSSRPGSRAVSVKQELKRTIPVIKKLVKRIKVPLSIDTYRPQVAKAALDNGVNIVNDVTGLRNPKMLKVLANYKCGIIIMHMQGMPGNMQKKPHYRSLIDEVIHYLDRAINRASDTGIDRKKIIIDPGIGFGKTLQHNLCLLKNLREFKVLGRPILVGTSRKSFIGKILDLSPQERIFGTVSSCVLAVENGANIVRVHDVKEIKQAIKVADAIKNEDY